MIRKSNLVPSSAKTFQSQKQLIRENIEFDSKNNFLIFHTNWSKTIQYGERRDWKVLAELGTRFDFLIIKKKAVKNKHHIVAS
jgi:hypothetical protein